VHDSNTSHCYKYDAQLWRFYEQLIFSPKVFDLDKHMRDSAIQPKRLVPDFRLKKMKLQIDDIQVRANGQVSLNGVERRESFLYSDQQEREISVMKIKRPWSHPSWNNTTDGQQVFDESMYFSSRQQKVFPLAGPYDTKQQDFVIAMSGPIFSPRCHTPLGNEVVTIGGRFPQSPHRTANGKAHQ
jgi:hypothetical protein